MCGIAGIWCFRQGRSEQALRDQGLLMGRRLAHRGPDDEGLWLDAARQLALVHRRLAIVDLSPGGHQPMVSPDGRYVIVFNGEIYNFQTLRTELQALGHVFRSSSDTEVMLQAFAAWGVSAALRRFAGMFAFALWDRETATLHLARDRLGKKPLYLMQGRAGLAFASEIKAFWVLPDFKPQLSPAALEGFLRFGYVADNLAIFDQLVKVRPGELMSIDADGGISRERYWSLGELLAAQGDAPRISEPGQAVDALLDVLRTATRERMVADVPLGAFLSGGIDSALVVALMQEQGRQRTRTFSVGFEESSHDEAPVARAVARHLGTEHNELYVTQADALGVVERLGEIYDEPFADASQIPTTLLAIQARRHVTVALTGDGGDEAFGGYVRYRSQQGLLGRLLNLPPPLRHVMAAVLDSVGESAWAGATQLLPTRQRPRFLPAKVHKLVRSLRADTPEERERVYLTYWDRPPLAAGLGTVLRTQQEFDAPAALGLAPSERMQFWETQHYLPGDLLAKMDRASMAASLEIRSPLLDHRVVELAWRLAPDLKAGPRRLKAVLREALFRYVPAQLVDLPKQGFSVPVGEWMRAELKDFAVASLDHARRHLADQLDIAAVDAAWRAHLAGRPGQAEALWAVVMLATWHRRWLGQPAG